MVKRAYVAILKSSAYRPVKLAAPVTDAVGTDYSTGALSDCSGTDTEDPSSIEAAVCPPLPRIHLHALQLGLVEKLTHLGILPNSRLWSHDGTDFACPSRGGRRSHAKASEWVDLSDVLGTWMLDTVCVVDVILCLTLMLGGGRTLSSRHRGRWFPILITM